MQRNDASLLAEGTEALDGEDLLYANFYEYIKPGLQARFSQLKVATGQHLVKLAPSGDYCIYIHYPYCDSICKGCTYARTINQTSADAYCRSLVAEMDIIDELPWPREARVGSVFFGGGTPSLIALRNLERIIAKMQRVFIRGASPQITIEVNPQSTTREKIDAWKSLGINRVSVGVQSFDPKVLDDFHRANDVEQIVDVIRAVAGSGMLFNVDLLYGSRSQTASSFRADVERAIDLSIPHVTMYPYFFGLPDKDKLRRQRTMYEIGSALLLSHGYEPYAVFEFARTEAAKSQSIIDTFVEPSKDVIALGAGPYGSNKKRGPYYKYKKVSTYQACIERGIPPFFINREDDGARNVKRLGLDGLYGLKIDRRECAAAYGDDPYLKYRDIFDMLAAVGHVEITDDQITVTRPFRQGILIMSSWFDAMKMPRDPAIEEILEQNPQCKGPGSGVDRGRFAPLQ